MIHPNQSVHQRSIDVVNISGDHAPDHWHPEYNERQYIQYVVRWQRSWPVESYTMRPTPTNCNVEITWHIWWILWYANHSHRVDDERALHTQSSWSNRESMRRGGSRSYEVTTLLSISKRKKRPNYWKMNKRNRGGDTHIHTSIYFDQGTIYNRICWNE